MDLSPGDERIAFAAIQLYHAGDEHEVDAPPEMDLKTNRDFAMFFIGCVTALFTSLETPIDKEAITSFVLQDLGLDD